MKIPSNENGLTRRRGRPEGSENRRPRIPTGDERTAWPFNEWLLEIGGSKPWFYGLPNEQRPETIKIRNRLVVVESPVAWARRVGTQVGGALEA